MIELNKRLIHKVLCIKVTPLASYILNEGTTDNDWYNVIYLCDIETKCNRYTDYIAEKLLAEDYDIEDVIKKLEEYKK